MRRFVAPIQAAVQAFALGLGGPGLALLTFLDASFMPLPQVSELLLVVYVTRHPAWWLYYTLMATLGSIGGCWVFFSLARRGGEAVLSRYLKGGQATRGVEAIRRYGVLAVFVPAIMPIPVPFKPFILVAGATGVSRARFLGAVALARGLRYAGYAIVAYWYGGSALGFITRNLRAATTCCLIALIVIGVAVYLWRRRRSA